MHSSNILQVTSSPQFDDAISRLEYHVHQPYSSPNFELNDEVRICIQTQDIFTLPSSSFLYIEGSITGEHADKVKFTSNAGAFLFNDIRYEIAGVEVDRTTNVGITSTIKNYLSLKEAESTALENAGWGEKFCENTSKKFSVCIPLKILMGFFEDYRKILMNVKQELILSRASTNKNLLISTSAVVDASKIGVEVNKLSWYMPYVQVSDANKLQLFKIINSNNMIDLCFRTWELYQYPELPKTNQHIWSVKTSLNLERPRYIIIAFQTTRDQQIDKDCSKFDHCNITNVRAFLNSEIYPYSNMNQNFSDKQIALFYDMYCKFQTSYYHDISSEPLLSKTDFINTAPLFVIDCSKQSEALKSTTVDLRLEFESNNNFPDKTRAYCLIIHDKLVQYNPLANIVTKLV